MKFAFTSISIVSLWLLCCLCFDCEREPSFHGNELEQFYRYVNTSNPGINWGSFYNSLHACETSAKVERRDSRVNCRQSIFKSIHVGGEHRVHRERSIGEGQSSRNSHVTLNLALPFLVTCTYDVNRFSSRVVSSEDLDDINGCPTSASKKEEKATERYSMLTFFIHQHSCSASAQRSAGGSTFEITATSPQHLSLCRTVDFFNSFYRVDCLAPLLRKGQGRGSEKEDGAWSGLQPHTCLNVTVTLHFEHFDAFSDVGEDRWVSLQHSVFQQLVCTDNNNNNNTDSSSSVIPAHIHMPVNTTLKESMATSSFHTEVVHGGPFWTRGISPMSQSSPPSLPHQGDYQWRGPAAGHPSISSMQRCVRRNLIIFVGDKHLKNMYNFTASRYQYPFRYIPSQQWGWEGPTPPRSQRLTATDVNESALTSSSDIQFQQAETSAALALYLDSVQCAVRRTTLVLHVGGVDLQHAPLRALLFSPHELPAVVLALRRLLRRTHRCPTPTSVVWLGLLPHPWCRSTDSLCVKLMNYWGNSAAVRAANQYIEQQVHSLSSSSKVVFLDPSLVSQPRVNRHHQTSSEERGPKIDDEVVCVNFFVCNSFPKLLVSSPSGEAIVREILWRVCESEDLSSGTTEKWGESGIVDGLLLLGSPSNRWFTVELGCRREIPDEPTLRLLSLSSPMTVSDLVLDDIPVCFRAVHPSRSNGTLLQPFSSLHTYLMDSGVARQLASPRLAGSLSLSLTHSTVVMEDDFDVIPRGRLLQFKSDCHYCKHP